ncbi:enoyl-ACP reductase FabI, partial [Alcaligenes pakistanensis]
MGFLQGKRILVTGVISNRSIAYGIAQACRQQGAEIALTYVGERFKERVEGFAAELGTDIVLPCDVSEDDQIEQAIALLGERWDGLDGLVHSIGFAPRESIAGNFLDGLSRESFRIAHDISAYSFPALAKAALPLLKGRKSSVLTLTYLGAEKAIPNYNTMGVAKAALEASVRYLAVALGEHGIRANAISAGPIKTLAASGIKDFSTILKFVETHAPLQRNVTIEEVGNVASFLMSELASGITGEITHVDAGFNCIVPGMQE